MIRTASAAVVAMALLGGMSAQVLGDDLTPPPWRFNAGTTVQHWNFSAGPAGGAGGAPDAGPLNNPYGAPTFSAGGGSNWFPVVNGRNALWNLPGGGPAALVFDVPNTGVQTHQKELWLQITYFDASGGTGVPGWTVAGPTGLFSMLGAPVTTPLAPAGWFHELTKWSVASCPPFERVSVFNPVAGTVLYVDQVVIDTQCFPVPGPGSCALLGLCGMFMARRPRRQQQ